MATSTLGMNGLCRVAGALLLFALLSEVMCEDDTISTTISTTNPTTNPSTQGKVDVSTSGGGTTQSGGTTAAPSNLPTTVVQPQSNNVATPSTDGSVDKDSAEVLGGAVAMDSTPPKNVVPDVMCVGKDELHTSTVKAEVTTNDCEATKTIIKEDSAPWCHQESCQLRIFQDKNTILVSSNDTKPSTILNALQSENLKKLGVTKPEIQSSSRSVFVGLLVTGLLAAIALTVGYFKCQRRPAAKGARLAEEDSPVDPENQGNTLASEAPLNPPPETQEKPNINGESPEAEKTQSPPPTNGHSNAKTADTEL